jgi:hypothetical protein
VAAPFCKQQRLLFLLPSVIVALVWFDEECEHGQSDVASSDVKMTTHAPGADLFLFQKPNQ